MAPHDFVRFDSPGSEADCIRYDLARFSPRTVRTPQGFLKAPAFFTRTGVLEYTRADGSKVRELRPEEEVFHEDSLATLQGIPLVLGHPTEGMVTPENAKKLSIGWGGDTVERKDSMVAGALTIMDASVISGVATGDLRELSMGYRMRIDPTPGVHPVHGRYDQVQRHIRYNHAALLDKSDPGRAGPEVGLRLDANGAVQRADSSSLELLVKQKADLLGLTMRQLAEKVGIEFWDLDAVLGGWRFEPVDQKVLQRIATTIQVEVQTLQALVPDTDRLDTKREPMETIVVNGVEIEVTKAGAQIIRQEIARQDAKSKELQAENEKLQGRFDAQAEELKGMKTKLEEATDPARLDSATNDRIELITKARKVLGDEAKIEGTAQEIRELVLRHDNKDLDLTGKSEDYIAARFDSFMENFEPGEKGAGGNLGQARRDALSAAASGGEDRPSAEKSQEEMRKRNADAWQEPLTVTTDKTA